MKLHGLLPGGGGGGGFGADSKKTLKNCYILYLSLFDVLPLQLCEV
jgi:hypothetical protein